MTQARFRILLLLTYTQICLPMTASQGRIVVDPENPAWLIRDDGRPFFLAAAGDPEGFLYRGKRNADGTRAGDQIHLIRKLAQHGGNGIYLMAVRTHGGDAASDHTHSPETYPDDLHNPWIDGDPTKGLNESILDQWEHWFSEMDRHGITIFFFIHDDSIKVGEALGWPLDAQGNLHPDERAFIQAIVNRFKHHRNLIWCVMEEGQEIGERWQLHISKIAEAIRQADEYRHPIAAHQLSGNVFLHADDPNIDQFALQANLQGIETPEMLHDWVLEAWRLSGGRYNLNMSEDPHHATLIAAGDRAEIRLRNWATSMAGAYVMVLGMDIASTAQEQLADLRRLQDFFESTDFHRMVPRDDLAHAGTRYVLARPSHSYIAYTPIGSAELGLRGLPSGRYQLNWFDPAEGKRVLEETTVSATGDQAWAAPRGFGEEVALYVKRIGTEPGKEESGRGGSDRYFPPTDREGGWRTLTDPDQIRRAAGMDREKLDEAFRFIQGSTKNGGLLVLRRGWLVYEDYFGLGHREATPNLASCGKSITSIAIGILLAERPELFPQGLEQKVFTPEYFPPEAFPLTDPAKADIKLGQLLAFTAGIRGNNPVCIHGEPGRIQPPGPDGWPALVDEIALGKKDVTADGTTHSTRTLWCEPGGGYSYATASIHLASIMLRHVTGMELEHFVRERLARPLGWESWGFAYRHVKAVTHTPGGGGIALRANDMLRFGYLLLSEGRWADRQIVPAEYVRHASRQSPYNPHYGYSLQFSVNTDGHYADLPRDAFWKSGSGGHVLYIVPSLDLVVWKLGGRDGQYSPENTGLPTHPQAPSKARNREDWIQLVDTDRALRQTLKMVVDSIVMQ